MARVLIIEDDASSSRTLLLVLEGRIEAEIETCSSAQAALKRIATLDFDVIVSDVKMPGMDGLAFLKEIRNQKPHTPVIMITAYEEPEVLVQALRLGAYDFIRKPFDVEYLVSSVTRALRHATSVRENEKRQLAIEERTVDLQREVELREQHRLLVENVQDYAIFALDTEGNIVSWNIGAERIKGYRAAEIIGKHFSCFYPPEDVRARKPEMELKVARANGRIEDEGWRIRKDGSRFWANVVITALKDRNGTIRGFGKVTRDLTERKRAEEAKERLLEEKVARLSAEALNKAKDQFFATLSHELRSPLTPMLGWTKLLLEGNLNQDMQIRGLTVIQRSVHMQAKLIEDILDVSRIITGKMTLNVRRMDFVRVIQAALDIIRPSADAKGIEIQSRLPENGAELTGDPERLQQVVSNVLVNAVKFTPSGGSIDVRLTVTDSQVELMVSDTGQGIAPEFLPHIFERFSQADSSAARVHGGMGIGLALVKSLVELHHGTVRAESAGKGKGATFSIKLPVGNQEWIETNNADNARAQARNSNSRILEDLDVLVVEDEADTRELITFILRQAGATVRAADSVREAMEIYKLKRPDAVVSDLGMPGEDGFQLISRIRSQDADQEHRTPALALTAYAQDEDRMRCLAAGFQVHIPKPIDPATLVMAVSKLLEEPVAP